MTCEGCSKKTEGYDLFDYCEHCSANLCPDCMANKPCRESPTRKHEPSEPE